jgi:hypothetical protein
MHQLSAMNIYDYLEEGEVIDKACHIAAQELINAGIQVISVDTGKNPVHVKSLSMLREKPINQHNIGYYFDRDDVGLGIMLRGKMEVVDIDEKVQKGITERVLQTLEMAWPELYERLPISITPSGGAHIYYYSDTIGGDGVLAQCFDANGKTAAKIERIDEINKHYIVTAPTPGYHFRQKSPLEMPHLTTEERGFIISICRSFNEVHISEAPKYDQKRDDAPYKVFNEQHDWRYIVEQITERGWKVVKDLPDRVVIKSPSTKQAQSGSIWKDTADRYNLKNCLYLFTHNSEFDQAKPYGPFDIYKTYYHDGNFMQAQAALAEKGYGKNIQNEGQFWTKHGNRINVKYTELNHYFKELGYRTYMGQIVQVVNNIVAIREVKDLVKQFLQDLEPQVKDTFHERVGTIFADKGGFMAMLDELDDNFIRDDADSTWLFFRNRAVCIKANSTDEYLYKELKGYIWKDNVIDRDYSFHDFSECDAHRFISILGGVNVAKLEAIIGYVLNRHKDELITKAVILMEDIDPENEGESMGRSGKGLIFKMIEKFRKTCRMNGKSFTFTDNFLWQNVELDTDIIFIDDVEKNFAFNKLYSVITESIQVNKKNQKQIIIPYEQSPKIFITSNYAVGNSDESTTDRKFEFPVVKHFNAAHKPIDEFGRAFFTGWDGKEWTRFDNFMIHCAKTWLASDRRGLSHLTSNSAIRVLINQTHPDFVAYMDDQLAMNFFDFAPAGVKNARVTTSDGRLITNAVNMDLWDENREKPDFYFLMRKEELCEKLKNIPKISTTKVTQWMKLWSEIKGVKIELSYKKSYEIGRFYRVVEWEKQVQALSDSGNSHFEASKDDDVPYF